MALILLAVCLAATLCVIAYKLAIYASPVLVGTSAAQYSLGAGAGILTAGLAATGAMLVLVVFVGLGFAKNQALQVTALAVVALPAMFVGYGLVHGFAKSFVGSAITLNLLGVAGGLFIGIASMLKLNAVGPAILSRECPGVDLSPKWQSRSGSYHDTLGVSFRSALWRVSAAVRHVSSRRQAEITHGKERLARSWPLRHCSRRKPRRPALSVRQFRRPER